MVKTIQVDNITHLWRRNL